jgi:hypothetical protein
MMRRVLAAAALGLLAACSAPDYTPVRDWARMASLVADHPGAIPPAEAADGAAAMRDALATYLAALGRMADDGVLPYLEDPFLDLAPRAARADPAGGDAVAGIGRTLRRASRQNWQAPDLRYAVAAFDPPVQALAASLAGLLERDAPGSPGAAAIRRIGRGHALLAQKAGDITREEVVRMIRAEEDGLRRTAFALPRPAAAPVP